MNIIDFVIYVIGVCTLGLIGIAFILYGMGTLKFRVKRVDKNGKEVK